MDETTVRDSANAHAQAIVAGDLGRAGSDLSPEAMESAGTVMKQMPRPVTGAEIVSVEADGDAMVCKIRYSGDESEAMVASRWQEKDGEPKIVRLDLA
jgi:hypothetical protein